MNADDFNPRSPRRLPAPRRIPVGTSFFASPDVALVDILDEACEILEGGSLTAVVAWASAEGGRILWDLADGRIRIEVLVVGVARGGTDRAALFAARCIADSSFVYLDGRLASAIAHFKVYRFRGSGGRRIAIVGSANLTRGGLLDNEETSVVIFDDGTASIETTAALDQIDRWIADHVGSEFSQPVNDGLIATLIAQGVVPVKQRRDRRGARRDGDPRVAVTAPRRQYPFRPVASPIIVPEYDGPALADDEPLRPNVPEGMPAVPPRTQWRVFVHFFGVSESNRTRDLRGTHEFNVAMPETLDQQFWSFPALFSLNASGMSDQRTISVRFTAGNKSEVVKAARIYRRLRDMGGGNREVTETRLRPLTSRAMRIVYDGIDIGPDALLVVERGADVDYEARVVLPGDPDYAALAPPAGLVQAYYA